MNKLAQFIYEYEKQISDEDFVESEAKERISQIKTIDDVKEYYLVERGWDQEWLKDAFIDLLILIIKNKIV
jgi:hypothetical protein